MSFTIYDLYGGYRFAHINRTKEIYTKSYGCFIRIYEFQAFHKNAFELAISHDFEQKNTTLQRQYTDLNLSETVCFDSFQFVSHCRCNKCNLLKR